jgi:hypothetical protein
MGGVTRRFPKKSFVSLGKFPAERLGLSPSRSDELRLLQAWSRAAGSRLAAKATPLKVRRGVLELRMTANDDAWCHTLFDVIPGLAASIAAAHPALGVKAVRLLRADGRLVGEVQPITVCEPLGRKNLSVAPHPEAVAAEEPGPPRLERVMRAYLARSESSSSAD